MKNELTLDELLRDPIVLTVMRADRVQPDRLRRELRQVGDRFINGRGHPQVPHGVPSWMAARKQGATCTW